MAELGYYVYELDYEKVVYHWQLECPLLPDDLDTDPDWGDSDTLEDLPPSREQCILCKEIGPDPEYGT